MPNKHTPEGSKYPQFHTTQLYLILVLASLTWFAFDLVLQGIHEFVAYMFYRAWSDGWLGCGWRKTPLLSYWNSTHFAVTGETNCLLSEPVWFGWRQLKHTDHAHSTIAEACPTSDRHCWTWMQVRPEQYADHHYTYRGFIPITLSSQETSKAPEIIRFSYYWRWNDVSMTDDMNVTTSVASSLPVQTFSYVPELACMPTSPSDSSSFELPTEIRIGMIADNQYGRTPFLRLLRDMRARQPHVWLHAGDAVQRGGRLRDWEMDFFSPIALAGLHTTPLIYVRGNHDDTLNHWSWAGNYGRIYIQSIPSWYAITLGSARWIILDANRDHPEQDAFLKAELQSEATAKASFVIVAVHVPPYLEYWSPEGWARGEADHWGAFVRRRWAPLFEAYGVDLVISGHQHNYQRGQRNHTVYTIIGGGGGPLDRHQVTDWGMYERTVIEHHYVIVTLSKHQLQWRAYALSGQEIDAFDLTSRAKQDGIVCQ
jgi:predicted phosphodiesterase